MKDLTIIYVTANKVPKKWAEFHRQKLEEAVGDAPVISVSFEPMDWGINIIQTEYSIPNLYRQILKAAKMADTQWIATADDDTLYPKEHYEYRGKKDGFYYNLNRWQLANWLPDFYFYKPKPGNGCMIATRELLIEKLEERFKVDPDLSQRYHQKELGTWTRWTRFNEPDYFPFYTENSIVTFYHDYSADQYQRHHKKIIYPVRAYDIPLWGRAEDLNKKFV